MSECANGYAWDYSEYLNELHTRDLLEALLADPVLHTYPEHEVLREQVELVDAQFRALLDPRHRLPNDGPWWRTGVLASAGSDYAEYIRDAYAIPVVIAPEST